MQDGLLNGTSAPCSEACRYFHRRSIRIARGVHSRYFYPWRQRCPESTNNPPEPTGVLPEPLHLLQSDCGWLQLRLNVRGHIRITCNHNLPASSVGSWPYTKRPVHSLSVHLVLNEVMPLSFNECDQRNSPTPSPVLCVPKSRHPPPREGGGTCAADIIIIMLALAVVAATAFKLPACSCPVRPVPTMTHIVSKARVAQPQMLGLAQVAAGANLASFGLYGVALVLKQGG